MKILIVEDDDIKMNQMLTCIRTILSPSQIQQCRSYNSGLRALMGNHYDLVLLDMSLPAFDITHSEGGGRPLPYGGRELLQKIWKRGLTCKVAVVTQFDFFGEGDNLKSLQDLTNELKKDFPNIFLETIYFASSSNAWKSALEALLAKIQQKGEIND